MAARGRAVLARGMARGMSTAAEGRGWSSARQCLEIVRERDGNNYAVGLFFPRHAQRAFFAIRAFNAEVASVKELTSNNVMTGHMRLQFWLDAVDAIYDGSKPVPANPVAEELARAVAEHDLTKRWVERLVFSRLQDLQGGQPQTMDDLEWFYEHTSSSVLYLLLEVLGVRRDKADMAASHVGVASGIANLLQATPVLASQGEVYVPMELFVNEALPSQVLRSGPSSGEQSVALCNVMFEVASTANSHLEAARKLIRDGDVELAALPALYSGVRADMYLKDLQATGFDVFNPRLQQQQNPGPRLLRHLWQLTRAYWNRTI